MKKPNKNLSKAKKAKNDEFYTQYPDVNNELKNYREHFKDKVVYCNCDRVESNFVKYFKDNFKHIKLKGLHYNHIDFRSEESINTLKEVDIVVTNPPFSLFREYIAQLIEYDKKFIIVGNMNAVVYKEVFPLIKDNKVWLGVSPRGMDFIRPNGETKNTNATWFTNLSHNKRNEEMILFKKYNEEEYPKYDNYDAINIDKTKYIPIDYEGVMGVPISFLDKYNPEQFEILECREPCINLKTLKQTPKFKEYKSRQIIYNGELCQKTYHRILIKRKVKNNEN